MGRQPDSLFYRFEKHPNPHNISFATLRSRILKHKMTFEEAMSLENYTRIAKSEPSKDRGRGLSYEYHNHENPYNLKFDTVLRRVNRRGITVAEAMSYPSRRKDSITNQYRNHPNPHNVNYGTFIQRVNSGQSVEEALSYERKSKLKDEPEGLRGEFNKLENPYGISLSLFKKRVSEGMTYAEAMNTKPKLKSKINAEAREFYDNYKNPTIEFSEFLRRVKFGLSFDKAINKEYFDPENNLKFYKSHENPYGVSYQAYMLRIKNGLTPSEALSKESRRSRNLTEFYNNHPNPLNIPKNTFLARTQRMSPEEAMITPIREKDNDFLRQFNENDNIHDLSIHTVYYRVKKMGQTVKEAMSYPTNDEKIKSKEKEMFEKHPNPYNLSWRTVYNRMKSKGESFEEAISYPLKRIPNGNKRNPREEKKLNQDRVDFENHENPYNLIWETVKYRMKQKGENLDKAMSYPAREKTNIKLKDYL